MMAIRSPGEMGKFWSGRMISKISVWGDMS